MEDRLVSKGDVELAILGLLGIINSNGVKDVYIKKRYFEGLWNCIIEPIDENEQLILMKDESLKGRQFTMRGVTVKCEDGK